MNIAHELFRIKITADFSNKFVSANGKFAVDSRCINNMFYYTTLLKKFLVFVLLILCILTRPAGSSHYCRTRKNIQRYCTPKHPIRYIYFRLWQYSIRQNCRVNALGTVADMFCTLVQNLNCFITSVFLQVYDLKCQEKSERNRRRILKFEKGNFDQDMFLYVYACAYYLPQ